MLVVLPFPMRAEGSAAERCAVGLIRGLMEHGVDVVALSADARRERVDPAPADLPIEVLRFQHPSLWRTRVQRYWRPHDLLAHTPYLMRAQELAREVDVVHCVELEAGSLIPRLEGPALAQVHCSTRADRDLGPPWTSDGRTAIELLRAERRVFRAAPWLLANSDEVAGIFRHDAPRAQVAVAPLALDPRQYDGRAPLAEPVAGLIGTAVWPPTANAVRRLLRDVWPLVLRQRPGARLRLAGRGMERAAFADLPDLPGVEWCGSVPSATGFLRELGLLLYPCGRGSGAKVKVLEALALGLPIVTTPDGAEGIGGDRAGIAVETEDARLAGAAVTLLADATARREAGDAAHRTFSSFHAPGPAAEPLISLYERMLG